MKKLRVDNDVKTKLNQMRQLLSNVELDNIKAGDIIEGCGHFCMVTCSYYCEYECAGSCFWENQSGCGYRFVDSM